VTLAAGPPKGVCRRGVVPGRGAPGYGAETMRSAELRIETAGRRTVDITAEVERFLADAGGDGLLNVFVPHATAGVALMETGSGSESDLEELLGRLLPRDDRYVHRHGSVGHGGDHLLPVLVSPSVTIPVEDGRPLLGTWQSIVLIDPNRENDDRRVRLSFLPGPSGD
jgi:secondary thiamine-phosphate synthase enzyme